MKVVHPPDMPDMSMFSIFLAGGITGCPDWRSELIPLLHGNAVLLNPLRESVPDAEEQIKWERKNILIADAMLFWFPMESVCPITLFELGSSLWRNRLIVGMHTAYPRRLDIEVQLRLARPDVIPVYSLQDVASLAQEWLDNRELVPNA